jgi:hypothetical protein
LKAKLWLFFASLLLTLSVTALVSAQTGQTYLKEDFNYSSLDQMQATGWTFTRPAGISVASSAVTLDGTGGDCAINRATGFSNDIYDWKAEVRSLWLGQGHSVLSVFLGTEKHSYGWAADGYYKEYSFYRDSQKILHFGNYAEKANEYVLLTMVREGNTFSFYFNGNLINTYTEEDTAPSKVTSLALVSPWRGDAKYDYFQIGEPDAAFMPSTPTESTSSFPMVPVLIGGGITAAIVGGIVVYYFVFMGSSSASVSTGSGIGSAGVGSSGGTGEGGTGSVIQEQPISPLSGEAPVSPLSGETMPDPPDGYYWTDHGTIKPDPKPRPDPPDGYEWTDHGTIIKIPQLVPEPYRPAPPGYSSSPYGPNEYYPSPEPIRPLDGYHTVGDQEYAPNQGTNPNPAGSQTNSTAQPESGSQETNTPNSGNESHSTNSE